MPWQRLVADVAGELVRDEESGFWVPAYPEVVFTVPRQSGKTSEILVWKTDRVTAWEGFDGKPQAVAYTAQSGSDARKKFRKDMVPLWRTRVGDLVADVRFAAEDMSIEWRNGARIEVWNNSEGAGHGSTVDLGVLDEVFADVDDRREQALLPAMATRHDRQKLVASTAGTETSIVYLRKQAAGRAAVMEGRREGVAYFEWSADSEEDPESPATWRGCHPALGFTVSERTVRLALEEMRNEDGGLAEFSRAWLNVSRRRGGEQVIPEHLWRMASSPAVRPAGSLVFGADAKPDRSAAAIVAVDGEARAELIEHRPEAGWLTSRVKELAARHGGRVAVDVGGPAGGIVDDLERADVSVIKLRTREMGYACGAFMDRLADGRLMVRADKAFDAAVEGARKRPHADLWLWTRRDLSVDISPLVALTVGLYAAVAEQESLTPGIQVIGL